MKRFSSVYLALAILAVLGLAGPMPAGEQVPFVGRLDLPENVAASEAKGNDFVALDEALSLLEVHDPEAARLVKLRYFAGLAHQDAAEALGISRGAADRLWALGRAWLFRQLSK
jgi:DNA-directed RNA polymerase specialized sigma24 family protein